MPALLQIRNVPDDARRILKARAAAEGESLNSYLLAIIDREVQRPTVAEVLARADGRSERAKRSSVAALHEGRRARGASAGR